MRKTLVSLGAAAALLLTGTAVRADLIPWGYSASDTQIFNSNNPIKTSSIKFAGSSGAVTSPDGKAGIIIYNLSTTSSALPTAPDSFSSVPFNLGVTLTDINATSSKSALAVSSGVANLSGTFSATNVSQSSMFPGMNTYTTTPTTLKLGAPDTGWNDYTIQVVSFTPPGQPGGAPGSILATVTVTPEPPDGSGNPPPTGTPEPASLVLAGLALPALALARRRMKQAARA
jgi:hypothetical protein